MHDAEVFGAGMCCDVAVLVTVCAAFRWWIEGRGGWW